MTLKKKIAIGVGILCVIGALFIGLMGFGLVLGVDSVLAKNEPQLRQYMQMDRTAQDAYILENIAKLASEDANQKPENKEMWEMVQKDPAASKASIAFGRSLYALAILHSDAIVADMDAETKAKYQQEADQLSDNTEKFSKEMERFEKKQ